MKLNINKNLFKAMTLSIPVVLGLVTATSALSSINSGPKEKSHTIVEGEYKKTQRSDKTGYYFAGFEDGVLEKLKAEGVTKIVLPTDPDIIEYSDTSADGFWGDCDFIKTVEVPANIASCDGYKGSCCNCMFPSSTTKLIIDNKNFKFDFYSQSLSLLHNLVNLKTIVFNNAQEVDDIQFSTGDSEGFSQCGIETDHDCWIKCPKMSAQNQTSFLAKLQSTETGWDKTPLKLPDFWKITSKK